MAPVVVVDESQSESVAACCQQPLLPAAPEAKLLYTEWYIGGGCDCTSAGDDVHDDEWGCCSDVGVAVVAPPSISMPPLVSV